MRNQLPPDIEEEIAVFIDRTLIVAVSNTIGNESMLTRNEVDRLWEFVKFEELRLIQTLTNKWF